VDYVAAQSVFGSVTLIGRWICEYMNTILSGGGMIIGRGKLKCLEKILVHCHFIQYKSHTFSSGMKLMLNDDDDDDRQKRLVTRDIHIE